MNVIRDGAAQKPKFFTTKDTSPLWFPRRGKNHKEHKALLNNTLLMMTMIARHCERSEAIQSGLCGGM